MISKLVRIRFFKACVVTASALSAGCVGPVPPQDVRREIEAAAGVSAAVQWHSRAEPVSPSTGRTGPLTTVEAVRLALLHDPGLQAAMTRVRIAAADAEQTRLLPNPVLSVSIRIPTDGGGRPLIDAGLAADLLAVLQRPRRANAADARLRSASAAALTVALDLILDVQICFAAAAALDAEIDLLWERKAVLARLLDVARSRVRLGEASRLDALTLDGERLSLDVEAAEKAAELGQRKIELARLIGQPMATLDDPLPADDPTPPWTGDENACVTAALLRRPEAQAQRWELTALFDDRVLSGWAAANERDAGVNDDAGRDWLPSSSSVLDGSAVGIDAERDPDWSVGPAVTIPVPVFDWGQARRAKATAAVIEARHNLVKIQRQIVQDVRQAVDALRRTRAVLRTARDELIPLQQRRIEQAEAAYRNGLADGTVVLIAEQQGQAARQRLIELRQKVATAQYRLDRAVGGTAVRQAVPTTEPASPATAPSTQGQP